MNTSKTEAELKELAEEIGTAIEMAAGTRERDVIIAVMQQHEHVHNRNGLPLFNLSKGERDGTLVAMYLHKHAYRRNRNGLSLTNQNNHLSNPFLNVSPWNETR